MALSDFDRQLLERCLGRKPRSWEEFVDRFTGLVVHVSNHASQSRSIRLSASDREDLAAEVFLTICRDDFAVLRHFRGQSSLATYLTVVARRVVVHELLRAHKNPARLTTSHADSGVLGDVEQRIADRDEVDRLLSGLGAVESHVVRLYHLEGKTYLEISSAVGVPENSVGPILSRARERLRTLAAQTPRE